MMTAQRIREEVLEVLAKVAPEVDPHELSDDISLRTQVDLDSMDWLNFLVGIHRRLHIAIPEKDYAGLRTLSDVVRYVETHSPITDRDRASDRSFT